MCWKLPGLTNICIQLFFLDYISQHPLLLAIAVCLYSNLWNMKRGDVCCLQAWPRKSIPQTTLPCCSLLISQIKKLQIPWGQQSHRQKQPGSQTLLHQAEHPCWLHWREHTWETLTELTHWDRGVFVTAISQPWLIHLASCSPYLSLRFLIYKIGPLANTCPIFITRWLWW